MTATVIGRGGALIESKEDPMDFEAIVRRVRAEFLEMPGLSLTVPQAGRLWGLDQEICQRVIGALIGSSFLRCTSAGVITRADA